MLKSQAYELIKQRLFESDLLPGQFVTLREISERIEVAVGPVREAMQRLEGEGLVRIFPQRGVQIAPISIRLIRDTFGLRRLLEGPGVRRLAEAGDRDVATALLKKTKDVLKRESRGEIQRGDGVAFAVDRELHELAIGSLRNELVNEIYSVHQNRIRLIRLHVRFDVDREPGLNEHLPVLEAICDRAPEAAEAALLRHIDNSERRAIAAVVGRDDLIAAVDAMGGESRSTPPRAKPGARMRPAKI